MDFVLFTKTHWPEAPRLRHQVANLLAAHGHDLVFFERGFYLWGHHDYQATDRIRVVRNRWLIHPQLRVTKQLAWLNNQVEIREIRKVLERAPDIGIITFNFEYEFVRDLFPDSTILFVLNDDFIDGALSPRETAREIGATARMADRTLVTAYPLMDQVSPYTDRYELFLPWSRSGYMKPPAGKDRPDLIYWGYINDRIDERAVLHVMDSGITIHFFGPLRKSRKINNVLAHERAIYHPTAQLAEVRAMLDQCCASILPYDINYKQIAALTINNRGFEILGYGLPLLYSDLPALIKAPANVIYRCGSPEAYVEAYHAARKTFDASQPSIETFLADHTPEKRYEQLASHFPALRNAGRQVSNA